jgi:hypothetical protein
MWILSSAIVIDRHVIAGISIAGRDLLDGLDSPINPILGGSL